MRHRGEFDKRHLIYVAGALYALSLHKYVTRDPLAPGSGIQGYIEAALMCTACLCTFIASHDHRHRSRQSPEILFLVIPGIFALVSSMRSYNMTLSLGEGVLCFVVLGMSYLGGQAGLCAHLFRSIYWTYTGSLLIGLALGVALPGRFALFSVDEYTARTRLSVFSTFPGTMGETCAYLILLSPIIFIRPHYVSRLFLLAMNLLAGGKVSTILLLVLLSTVYLWKTRARLNWRLVASALCIAAAIGFSVTFANGSAVTRQISSQMGHIYGNDVANEAVSLDGRIDLWSGAIALLGDGLVLGYGFGGAREVLMNIAAWSGSSHNGFLEIGLSCGVLGLLIFMLGVLAVVRACTRRTPDRRRSALQVLAYMMIIAFTGVTFNFPSYFGFLVLVLLLYRNGQVSSGALGETCRA